MRRWIYRIGGAGLVLFLAIQLVPYGRDHAEPPEPDPPAWPTPAAAQAFQDACADCHSYDTRWPWYSWVAPASWLVQRDVDRGRDEWNVSLGEAADEADDAIETIEEGSMPPSQYELAHPDARLSDEERAALVSALRQLDDD